MISSAHILWEKWVVIAHHKLRVTSDERSRMSYAAWILDTIFAIFSIAIAGENGRQTYLFISIAKNRISVIISMAILRKLDD